MKSRLIAKCNITTEKCHVYGYILSSTRFIIMYGYIDGYYFLFHNEKVSQRVERA